MNRLKELRAGKYTQAEMAKLLGVGRTTYTKYESGDIRLSADMLSKLAKIFDVSIDAIVGDDGDEDDRELWEYREALRRDPERRMLFSLASATARELMSTPVTSKAMKHDLMTMPTIPTPHPRSTKRSILGPLALISFTSVSIRRLVPKSTSFLENTAVSV